MISSPFFAIFMCILMSVIYHSKHATEEECNKFAIFYIHLAIGVYFIDIIWSIFN